jgi:hypothetical protein
MVHDGQMVGPQVVEGRPLLRALALAPPGLSALDPAVVQSSNSFQIWQHTPHTPTTTLSSWDQKLGDASLWLLFRNQ